MDGWCTKRELFLFGVFIIDEYLNAVRTISYISKNKFDEIITCLRISSLHRKSWTIILCHVYIIITIKAYPKYYFHYFSLLTESVILVIIWIIMPYIYLLNEGEVCNSVCVVYCVRGSDMTAVHQLCAALISPDTCIPYKQW